MKSLQRPSPEAGFTLVVTQRIFPVRYEWGRLSVGSLSAVALWAACLTLPAGPWWAPVKLGVVLCWPAILWLTGLVAPEETHYLREQVATLCHRVAGCRLALKGIGRVKAPGSPPYAKA